MIILKYMHTAIYICKYIYIDNIYIYLYMCVRLQKRVWSDLDVFSASVLSHQNSKTDVVGVYPSWSRLVDVGRFLASA